MCQAEVAIGIFYSPKPLIAASSLKLLEARSSHILTAIGNIRFQNYLLTGIFVESMANLLLSWVLINSVPATSWCLPVFFFEVRKINKMKMKVDTNCNTTKKWTILKWLMIQAIIEKKPCLEEKSLPSSVACWWPIKQ